MFIDNFSANMKSTFLTEWTDNMYDSIFALYKYYIKSEKHKKLFCTNNKLTTYEWSLLILIVSFYLLSCLCLYYKTLVLSVLSVFVLIALIFIGLINTQKINITNIETDSRVAFNEILLILALFDKFNTPCNQTTINNTITYFSDNRVKDPYTKYNNLFVALIGLMAGILIQLFSGLVEVIKDIPKYIEASPEEYAREILSAQIDSVFLTALTVSVIAIGTLIIAVIIKNTVDDINQEQKILKRFMIRLQEISDFELFKCKKETKNRLANISIDDIDYDEYILSMISNTDNHKEVK